MTSKSRKHNTHNNLHADLEPISELKSLSTLINEKYSRPYELSQNPTNLNPDEIINYVGNKLTEQEIHRLRLSLQARKNED
jgi:hypothetical protein